MHSTAMHIAKTRLDCVEKDFHLLLELVTQNQNDQCTLSILCFNSLIYIFIHALKAAADPSIIQCVIQTCLDGVKGELPLLGGKGLTVAQLLLGRAHLHHTDAASIYLLVVFSLSFNILHKVANSVSDPGKNITDPDPT